MRPTIGARALCLLGGLLGLLAAGAAEEGFGLSLGTWIETPLKPADAPAVLRRDRSVRFGAYEAGPLLLYSEKLGKAGAWLGKAEFGWPQPCSEGWYGGGFVELTVAGKPLSATPLYGCFPAENGPRAIADLVWRTTTHDVRLRWAGLPGDPRLWLQVDTEPLTKAAPVPVKLRLLAYPSFFTRWHKRVGARRVRLPGQTLAEGATATLTPEQGGWALLYDQVFDPAGGEGHGACAVAFDPATLGAVKVDVGDYAVSVEAGFKPGVRSARLALWKFYDRPNADVLAAFPALAAQAQADAATLDLTPAPVRTFDKAEWDDALAGWRKVPARLEAWLKAVGTLAPGIRRDTSICAGIEAYGDLLWEAKLDDLLDF